MRAAYEVRNLRVVFCSKHCPLLFVFFVLCQGCGFYNDRYIVYCYGFNQFYFLQIHFPVDALHKNALTNAR